MNTPKILDVTCGSRMFWFDRQDQRCLFADKRCESHILCDGRILNITPDVLLDFTNLPFDENQFYHVVFDPPHLVRAGKKSWLAKKYGTLGLQWQDEIKLGFAECFRVLKPNGILIFKWNKDQIKVNDILALTPHKPLYGHTTKRHRGTHWFTFMKD